jgi:excisionase family DNA binding protein
VARTPTPRKPVKRLVSITEAAEYTGLCRMTIYRYIQAGRITGYRQGPKLLRVDLRELDQLARPVPAVSNGAA